MTSPPVPSITVRRAIRFTLLSSSISLIACASSDTPPPPTEQDAGGGGRTPDGGASNDAGSVADTSIPPARLAAEEIVNLPGEHIVDFDVHRGNIAVTTYSETLTSATVSIRYGQVGKPLKTFLVYDARPANSRAWRVRLDASHIYFTYPQALTDPRTNGAVTVPSLFRCPVSGCTVPEFFSPIRSAASNSGDDAFQDSFAVAADAVFVNSLGFFDASQAVARVDKVSKAPTELFRRTFDSAVQDNGSSLLIRGTDGLYTSDRSPGEPKDFSCKRTQVRVHPELGADAVYALNDGAVDSCPLAGSSPGGAIAYAPPGRAVYDFRSDRGAPTHLFLIEGPPPVNGTVAPANVSLRICAAANCAASVRDVENVQISNADLRPGIRSDEGFAYARSTRVEGQQLAGLGQIFRVKYK